MDLSVRNGKINREEIRLIIDYKDTIKKYMVRNGHEFECKGVMVGGTFIPNDMIKQLYDAVFNTKCSVKHNHCKEIPNENEYEFYQWNGDPEDIKSVKFLTDLYDCFKVGCRDYGNYHLDYRGGLWDCECLSRRLYH